MAISRRTMVKRASLAVGAVVAGSAVLAFGEGDRGADAERPLFIDRLPGPDGGALPIIVFLPGLGGTTRYWKSRVAALAAHAPLVLVDLLGFGQSPKPWASYTVAQHVDALREVLSPLAAESPLILVGHSVGARLAVAYAARYPADVRQLVLVSLPYFGSGETAKGYIGRRGAQGWMMTHLVPAALACLVTRRVLGWALPYLMRDVPREVAEDLNQMTWRSSTSTLWEVIYDYDLAVDLTRIDGRMPMLCLHGDRDESAPLNSIQDLARTHRDCTVQVYQGATHGLPLEQPAWIRTQIAATLPS